MPLKTFDHVNIRTGQIDDMIAWYGDVLGLHTGPRPHFPFDGAWLYLGDQAVIHLVKTDHHPSPFDEATDDLRMEHIAFRATDHKAFIENLDARGVAHNAIHLDDIRLVLVNVRDPDGNHIHVDFDMDEVG